MSSSRASPDQQGQPADDGRGLPRRRAFSRECGNRIHVRIVARAPRGYDLRHGQASRRQASPAGFGGWRSSVGTVVLLEAVALRHPIRPAGRERGRALPGRGHLFTTIWIPGGSLKSLRFGWWRYQRCPVGHHWSVVTPVKTMRADRAGAPHRERDSRHPRALIRPRAGRSAPASAPRAPARRPAARARRRASAISAITSAERRLAVHVLDEVRVHGRDARAADAVALEAAALEQLPAPSSVATGSSRRCRTCARPAAAPARRRRCMSRTVAAIASRSPAVSDSRAAATTSPARHVRPPVAHRQLVRHRRCARRRRASTSASASTSRISPP